ncbi:MAG: cysteine--tRNA ligase [Acidobacteriota bacterium]|nr:cysteine--tRNA ligase [Acidobacteriota bacterium]
MASPRFYNSLGRELQSFAPQDADTARIYTCGPTVYDTAHIGNLRTFLFEDVLCRALEFLGYDVTQVMNLTDVEDKIIAGAVEREISIDDYVSPHIDVFFRDLERLHIRKAEHYPRATQHIPEMISMIQTLEERGFAYSVEGSVFFHIDRFGPYGRLSGVDLGGAKRGERVADDEYEKDDVKDFVLWKAAKEGEPSWDSPWGAGRPGWHIECSAMSMKYLGESFDIHCGGVDNMFPHHENEIAQSEAATDVEFARYWLHSEHLLVDGRKMSKSLGNQYTLDHLIARDIDLRAVRYLFLSVPYRRKLNFTFSSVEGSASALRRVDQLRFRLETTAESDDSNSGIATACESLYTSFREALADDLNLSAALATVHIFVRDANVAVGQRRLNTGDRQRIIEALASVDRVLGVLDAGDWPTSQEGTDDSESSDDDIQTLVDARQGARIARDWAEADRLRDELVGAGIVVEDTPDGVRWKRE